MTVPTIPDALSTALSPRYELRRVLGSGGMATVHLAYDRKHQREVAIKVLRPNLAASLGAERFLTEIQIAARLTHPHILALHDSGEAGGFLYYVMPYINGPSLRQRLEECRRMGRGDALAVAGPVADALTYAHRMGIFHRDIKPENILFSEGHPIVADFGIAKALSTAGGQNLTRTGFPLGTPGYMSPEQAAGMTDLDARTDVYSLAVTIYEMLVGEVPGRWPSEDAVRTGRFLEVLPAHRALLSEVGAATEGALVRGLAVRHDQRTATPMALIDQLRGTPAPPVRRHYGEDEVQEIVKRASELEATNPTTGGAMTIGGVESLAAEVGIAPEAVRAAAQSIRRPTSGPGAVTELYNWNKVIGGPTSLLYEREVEGELPESEFPVMVDEIRRVLGNVGQVSQLGRSFSWSGANAPGMRRDMQVAVSVRNGKTRIHVRENLGPHIGAIFGGIGGGVGGGGMGLVIGVTVGALNAPLALFAVIPAWFAGVYLLARKVYRRSVAKRRAQFDFLADRLVELAGEMIGGTPRRIGE